MNSDVYRWCAVPHCNNTSIKTPNKLFINVSMKKTIRNTWLNLARRDPGAISSKSVIYFCEDHFDLPNDMENYTQYCVMGSVSQLRMKPGCVPSKFECQRKQASNVKERPYVLKNKRKAIIEDSEGAGSLLRSLLLNRLGDHQERLTAYTRLAEKSIQVSIEFAEKSVQDSIYSIS